MEPSLRSRAGPAGMLVLLFCCCCATCFERPDFCGQNECPPFKTISKRSTYEVREYEPVNYVVRNVSRSVFTVALAEGYASLYKYFSGSNANGTKMDLTVPTVVQINLAKELQDLYTVALYLPEDFQDNPPEPTANDVVIVPAPKATSYVRVFGGFATKAKILEEAEALRTDLEKDDVEFQEDHFFFLLYDPPTKLTNRHNEVVFDAPYDKRAIPELASLEDLAIS